MKATILPSLTDGPTHMSQSETQDKQNKSITKIYNNILGNEKKYSQYYPHILVAKLQTKDQTAER